MSDETKARTLKPSARETLLNIVMGVATKNPALCMFVPIIEARTRMWLASSSDAEILGMLNGASNMLRDIIANVTDE